MKVLNTPWRTEWIIAFLASQHKQTQMGRDYSNRWFHPATERRGKTCVILPMPFVDPSRNNRRIPTVTNSGCLKKRNRTLAFSLVWIPPIAMIPSITAVCRTLPMWTVVWNPGWIAVVWNNTHTVACRHTEDSSSTQNVRNRHLF